VLSSTGISPAPASPNEHASPSLITARVIASIVWHTPAAGTSVDSDTGS
jgi:hypothetical protein